MKELMIKNLNSIESIHRERDGNEFYIKPVVAGADADQCSVAFVEVPPGNYAFGYHYHDQNEEVFYIVSGTGTLRTSKGEKTVKTGDMITFPTGEDGAHVLRNASDTETLIFIDFDTLNTPEIVHLPDTNKIMVMGKHFQGTFDKE